MVSAPLGSAAVAAVERHLPFRKSVANFLRSHAPDIVLVTPLVELGSPQVEYLRASKALGVPTLLPVASWDNLTGKGGVHTVPDVVAVWNEPQREEAVELQGVPERRICVTGAVAYDHWFDWAPCADRESFCARLGLDARRPYVLYLGSSAFVAPNEGPFVVEWARRIRKDQLQGVQALVRAHPTNALGLQVERELASLGVAIQPAVNPYDTSSRAEYFDVIHHSAAVAGVMTSGLIEATILDRPVHTLLSDRFPASTGGMLHFRHLAAVAHATPSLSQHAQDLERSLSDPDGDRELRRRFVESFVRPYGRDEAATPRLVAAIEETAAPG